jgi:hypothetical protein
MKNSNEKFLFLIGQFLKRSFLFFHRFSLPTFGSFGQAPSVEKIFLEINQPETKIAYGGHVC